MESKRNESEQIQWRNISFIVIHYIGIWCDFIRFLFPSFFWNVRMLMDTILIFVIFGSSVVCMASVKCFFHSLFEHIEKKCISENISAEFSCFFFYQRTKKAFIVHFIGIWSLCWMKAIIWASSMWQESNDSKSISMWLKINIVQMDFVRWYFTSICIVCTRTDIFLRK